MVGTGNGLAPAVEKFVPRGLSGNFSHQEKRAIHLADIKTPTGIVIKVRQATLKDAERKGPVKPFTKTSCGSSTALGSFRHNFDVFHALPHPHSDVARDIVWLKARRDIEDSTDGAFYRLSAIQRDHPDTALTKAIVSALGAPLTPMVSKPSEPTWRSPIADTINMIGSVHDKFGSTVPVRSLLISAMLTSSNWRSMTLPVFRAFVMWTSARSSETPCESPTREPLEPASHVRDGHGGTAGVGPAWRDPFVPAKGPKTMGARAWPFECLCPVSEG